MLWSPGDLGQHVGIAVHTETAEGPRLAAGPPGPGPVGRVFTVLLNLRRSLLNESLVCFAAGR